MEKTLEQIVREAFRTRFKSDPDALIKAPGRVNLIGEHTDYSDGFVLPVAIDLGIAIALRPRKDKYIEAYSVDFDEAISIDLEDLTKGERGWQEYVKGVAWVLMQEGLSLRGWDAVVAGNIPIGAGLSSSAALEVASVKAFSLAAGIEKTPTEIALIGRKAENDWVGVNVGIMDQLISAAGKRDHALLIDCQSLDHEHINIPKQIGLVVLDTMTRRELTNSSYNRRREEVEYASKILNVRNLRYATLTQLEDNRQNLEPVIYRRARHVISENGRVLGFCKAMRNAEVHAMGRLINDSHNSLRNDFEVSSRELNAIVDISQNHPSCLGARMTGAGFGGCALALVDAAQVEEFVEYAHRAYLADTGIEPNIFRVESADGVHVVLNAKE